MPSILTGSLAYCTCCQNNRSYVPQSIRRRAPSTTIVGRQTSFGYSVGKSTSDGWSLSFTRQLPIAPQSIGVCLDASALCPYRQYTTLCYVLSTIYAKMPRLLTGAFVWGCDYLRHLFFFRARFAALRFWLFRFGLRTVSEKTTAVHAAFCASTRSGRLVDHSLANGIRIISKSPQFSNRPSIPFFHPETILSLASHGRDTAVIVGTLSILSHRKIDPDVCSITRSSYTLD